MPLGTIVTMGLTPGILEMTLLGFIAPDFKPLLLLPTYVTLRALVCSAISDLQFSPVSNGVGWIERPQLLEPCELREHYCLVSHCPPPCCRWVANGYCSVLQKELTEVE